MIFCMQVKIFQACGRSEGYARVQEVWGDQLYGSPIAEVLPPFLSLFFVELKCFLCPITLISLSTELACFHLPYGVVLYTVHPQILSNPNSSATLRTVLYL